MRDEESVGRLLSRAFGTLVALLAGAGIIVLAILIAQHRDMQVLAAEVQPLQVANDELNNLMSSAQWAMRGYALTGDPQLLIPYDEARVEYTAVHQALRERSSGSDRTAITDQLAKADSWWQTAQTQRLSTPGRVDAVANLDQAQALFASFATANAGLRDSLSDRSDRLHRRGTAMWYGTLVSVALVVGVATAFGVRTAHRTRRRIVGPLDEVVRLIEGRRRSDHDDRVTIDGPAEIRALAEALNAAADQADLVGRHQAQVAARLQALDTAKTDFMSTVSHELRTPLTSISGYLELLRDPETGGLTPAQERMLDVIARNSRRLRDLIEDILTLSHIETGEYRSDLATVDLAEVIDRAVTTIAPAAEKASVGLHCEVRGPLPTRGDGAQLDRVLTNLLGNAVKFTPADGTVTIRADRQGDELALTVADTGMGIPAEEQQALFARFFRATNAIRQAVPGAGLGLAIVRTIVDNHGGSIEVDSTENVGTTVTVKLPAADA